MFLLSLLFVVVCVIAVFGFLGYGGQTLAGSGMRPENTPAVLRGFAGVAAAVAFGMYGWGLLGVTGALMEAEDGGTDSAPVRPCRTGGWQQAAAGIVDYEVRLLPLGFVCETSDGGTYRTDDVPGYVNPVVFGFGLAAAGSAISSAYVVELRARQRRRQQS
ncbi:hypothetical protein SUDANB105_04618 [Streptomyces sp. enrichment culture]|uniref:hypothetical protein n=1 Tax=Streptomyces sp. enrichment culture TaxID=1795815 RepID=UPI003F574058